MNAATPLGARGGSVNNHQLKSLVIDPNTRVHLIDDLIDDCCSGFNKECGVQGSSDPYTALDVNALAVVGSTHTTGDSFECRQCVTRSDMHRLLLA